MGEKLSRNAPCSCGSGKKYKQCCLGKPPPEVRRKLVVLPLILMPLALGLGALFWIRNGAGMGLAVGAGAVICVGIILGFSNPPPSDGGKGDAAGINFGS